MPGAPGSALSRKEQRETAILRGNGEEGQRVMNLRQKLAVVVMDLLLFVELGLSIHLGKQNPDEMVPVFLGSYIPMVLLTLLGARLIVRRLGTCGGPAS